MEIKDFKHSYTLQRTSGEEKSFVIRYKHPFLHNRKDCRISCNFLKLKGEELKKGKVYTSNSSKFKIYQDIIHYLERYITITDITKFDEEDFKIAIFSANPILQASLDKKNDILSIIEREKDDYFKNNKLSNFAKQNYTSAIEQFNLYEKYSQKKTVTIHHINHNFMIDYESFLINKRKYEPKTAKLYSKLFKALLKDYLTKKGLNSKLVFLSGYKSPIKIKHKLQPILTYEEIKKIYNTDFSKFEPRNKEEKSLLKRVQGLNNIKYWICIGFSSLQRNQTLRQLTNDNIECDKFVNIEQQKTNNFIPYIPFDEFMSDFFRKNNQLPYLCKNRTDFNNSIKLVCELMGFDNLIEGDKRLKVEIPIGKEGFPTKECRMVRGIYSRCELLTTHCLRHSGISNAFKKGIPDFVISSISGHKNMKVLQGYNNLTIEDKIELYRKLNIN